MKKIIALLLSMAMLLCLASCKPQSKEEPEVYVTDLSGEAEATEQSALPASGAWQRPESPVVTEELQALLDRALEGMTGATYTPVAYLGSQVVAGTNYALLCRVAPVVPDPVETYCVVCLYEDLEGHVEITQVEDSNADTNLSNEQLSGGWSQPESPELTEEARAALSSALENLDGADYEPLALLGTQVVAGMNYCILCQSTVTAPGAESAYVLVYVYQDLEGKGEITDIVDFKDNSQTEADQSGAEGADLSTPQ